MDMYVTLKNIVKGVSIIYILPFNHPIIFNKNFNIFKLFS